MSWRVVFNNEARKEFPLPNAVEREMVGLLEDLEAEGRLYGDQPLTGYNNVYYAYFANQGYRIVYKAPKGSHVVEILSVGPRKDVYRKLKAGKKQA